MPSTERGTLRLVTYNTQFCTGLDQVTSVARIVDEIRNADVMCLQEIDRHWKRTGYVDQAEELARAFPGYYRSFGPGIDVDASYRDSGDRIVDRRRQFGNMILSRWPLLTVRNHLLPKLHLCRPMSLQRAALEAVVDAPGGPLRVVSIHLAHAAASERELQIDRLAWILQHCTVDGGAWSGTDYPQSWGLDGEPQAQPAQTLVAGDFNMMPLSPEYVRTCGSVDPKHGPLSTRNGLVDAWAVAGHEITSGVTWGQGEKARRLDYVFTTYELGRRLERVWVDTAATGSDHKPVWAEFAPAAP